MPCPYLGKSRRFYFHYSKEATFGAGDVTGTEFSHKFDVEGSEGLLRIETEQETDENMATGTEFAIRQYIMANRIPESPLTMKLNSPGLGIWGAFALGADSHALVGAGAATYLHTITMRAITTDPPSGSMQEHANGTTANAPTDRRYDGVVLEGFDLSGGETGFVTLTPVFKASGATQAAVSEGSPGNNGTLTLPNFGRYPTQKVRISIQATATEHESPLGAWSWTTPTTAGTFTKTLSTSLASALESWTFRYRNNFIDDSTKGSGVSAGSGLAGGVPCAVPRLCELDLTFFNNSTTDDLIYDLFDSTGGDNVAYAVIIEGVSDFEVESGIAYESFIMAIPLAGHRQNASNSGGMGRQTESFTLFAKKDQSAQDHDPFFMYVINGENLDYAG